MKCLKFDAAFHNACFNLSTQIYHTPFYGVVEGMVHFKCTIPKLLTSFHFYLIMALVVPRFDDIFMVLLIFALENFQIGVTKPIFLDFGSPEGRGVRACVGMVCYHCIVHILI